MQSYTPQGMINHLASCGCALWTFCLEERLTKPSGHILMGCFQDPFVYDVHYTGTAAAVPWICIVATHSEMASLELHACAVGRAEKSHP